MTDLVPENHGPFGDYYVSREKVERSAQLKAALAALEDQCPFSNVIDIFDGTAQLCKEIAEVNRIHAKYFGSHD